jgi:short subunit dehydrogenase-like uncharacterized protein
MRDFDVVVYGATGFTGRLVAGYLTLTGATRWAMAGRDMAKLEDVRDLIGAPVNTPLITADADDAASLRALAERATVVLTTVGPYQHYGSALVAACAATGTAYVDLCGEPAWMRHMIDAHHAEAQRSGARIVFSCGFDSIPFDLGVLTLQDAARARYGRPAPRVKCRVRTMKGGFSGGTAASLKATLAAAARDPSLITLLTNPFALAPGFSGPHQPSGLIPEYDATIGAWVAPFIMAPINTKNVHRTNFLLGQAYGSDFVYDEMVVAGLGDMGKAAAEALAKLNPLASNKGPKPGEGPPNTKPGDYCGAAGSEGVPEGMAATSFQGPCIKHDDCYGTLGKTQEQCDQGLGRDILNECKRTGGWLCALSSYVYYRALAGIPGVISPGKAAYDNAQRATRLRVMPGGRP